MDEIDFNDDASLDSMLARIAAGEPLDAVEGAPQDTPQETPPAPVVPDTPAAPPPSDAVGPDERKREWNPDGPGNPAEALRQERERSKQLQAELARYQEAERAKQAELDRVAQQRQIETEIDGKYTEEVAATVQQREALAAEAARKAAAEDFRQQREKLSLSYLQKTHPDALERIGHFIDQIGEDAFLKLREQALDTDDPAGWLYAKAKVVPLPGEIDKRIEEAVAAKLAEALGKRQSDTTADTPPLAHLTSGTATPEGDPDCDNMSDAELKKYKAKLEAMY